MNTNRQKCLASHRNSTSKIRIAILFLLGCLVKVSLVLGLFFSGKFSYKHFTHSIILPKSFWIQSTVKLITMSWVCHISREIINIYSDLFAVSLCNETILAADFLYYSIFFSWKISMQHIHNVSEDHINMQRRFKINTHLSSKIQRLIKSIWLPVPPGTPLWRVETEAKLWEWDKLWSV